MFKIEWTDYTFNPWCDILEAFDDVDRVHGRSDADTTTAEVGCVNSTDT